MVSAILAGNKTMTRRIVKPQFNQHLNLCRDFIAEYSEGQLVKCPYGKTGDVLWVRESFTILEPEHCEGMSERFYYKAGHHESNEEWRLEEIENGYPYKWKPSIHMPKSACRIWLEITNIRVERLQVISGKDILSEGIDNGKSNPSMGKRWEAMQLIAFMSLWSKINGPASWNANPWIWVIEFKRIEKPE